MIVLFLVLICACVDGSQFRFDYTYNEEAAGWFKVHRTPSTWNEARIRCSLEGAVLASPTNKSMLASMMLYMKEVQGNDCGIYTGINARFSKGDFYSIEGVPLIRMPVEWMPDEPDNYNNDESCIVLAVNGSIADVTCSEVLPYICYKKAPSLVPLNICGTSDHEYTLFHKTGNCYKFHTQARNWTNAFMTCSAEGGYLAIPNNKEEADHIRDLFKNNLNRAAITTKYKDVMFLGFLDIDKNGVWTTIHGSPLQEVYSAWSNNQPDGMTNNQFCGAMFQTGLLDDCWCAKIAPFTCEKSPESLL